MKWFTILSHRTFFYRSIAALIIGLVAIFVPNNTLNFLVVLVGCFILLAGIGTAFTAYKAKHNILLSLGGVASIVSIIIGGILISKPDFFIKMIVAIFGIVLIIVGLMQIINVTTIRTQLKNPSFYTTGGVVTLIVGLVFLIAPKLISGIFGFLIGITLVLYAINELSIGFRMKKHYKTPKQPQIEDVEYEEA